MTEHKKLRIGDTCKRVLCRGKLELNPYDKILYCDTCHESYGKYED